MEASNNSHVSFADLNNTQELLFAIFDFCTPKENAHNTTVCRIWARVASEIAKKQLVRSCKRDIESKLAHFMQLVPLQLKDYYLPYAQCENLELNQLTIQEVRGACLTAASCEKFRVCLSKFFTINPTCRNIPENRKAELSGKTFVEIHYQTTKPFFDVTRMPTTIGFWTEDSKHLGCLYFPIEIFNLTVNQDRIVSGEKDTGMFYFILRGRLIELTLEEGNTNVHNKDFHGGIPPFTREKAHPVDLESMDDLPSFNSIQAFQLYIPRLHAKKSELKPLSWTCGKNSKFVDPFAEKYSK